MDAKDIYISNNYIEKNPNGYDICKKNGELNYSKFINTLDYSLDLIKLYEVYRKTYRRNGLVFEHEGKKYSTQVINVTFKYSNKEFNQVCSDTFVKFGYSVRDLTFEDCIAVSDGHIVGIKLNREVEKPVSADMLPNFFEFDGKKYVLAKHIPVLNTVDDLRLNLYRNGFMCNGTKYIRWKRSSGSARVGKCLFINENLYSRMHTWELCGLNVRKGQDIDLAALEAYISLPSSSIIGTLKIKPENILVIDDYESVFKDRAVVTYSENGRLKTREDEIEIHNSIWDGQSLIDASMIKNGHAMVLLRNLFFKSCCFSCSIQKWFEDNGIDSIEQLNGRTCAKDIKDIKLITTPNSIKYLKFGSLEQWLDNVEEDFGIVKYDKKTHYFQGRIVQIHYQLLNTLQLSRKEVEKLLEPTFRYLDLIKDNPAVLRYHIKYGIQREFLSTPALYKTEVVYKMLGINDDFAKTKIYKDFKTQSVIKPFISNLRKGHVYVNGNYSTLCGNPIEMLQSAIGRFSGESVLGIGNIHTLKFKDGQEVLGSRSPHVCQGNMWVAKNKRNALIDRYMNFSEEIVAVNSINENLMQRLSGCDYDSDSVLLTDNKILLNAAKKNYDRFLVPTCSVEAKKTSRRYTNEDKCDLDIKTSKNLIGQIVNLSQELNSLLWDNLYKGKDNKNLYWDICQLDVMSGLEIDMAKKEFDIDNAKELKAIKDKYLRLSKDGLPIRPMFFKYLAKQKGFYVPNKKSYEKHHTTMDYLQTCINSYQIKSKKTETIPFADILNFNLYNQRKVNYRRQVKRIIKNIRKCNHEIQSLYAKENMDSDLRNMLVADVIKRRTEFIEKMSLNDSTMLYLLNMIEEDKNKDIRNLMFYSLFSCANNSFYRVLKQSKNPIRIMVEHKENGFRIYDFFFKILQF